MYISEEQNDALKEIINIGVGRSASSLNKIIGKKVSLKVPEIDIITYQEVRERIFEREKANLAIVRMLFRGHLTGVIELVFSDKEAADIVSIVINDKRSEDNLDDLLKINTLTEIGNTILNALIGTLGNLLKTRMRYSVPCYNECTPLAVVENINNMHNEVIFAKTNFKIVNEDISGSFILFFELSSFDNLKDKLDKYINNTLD